MYDVSFSSMRMPIDRATFPPQLWGAIEVAMHDFWWQRPQDEKMDRIGARLRTGRATCDSMLPWYVDFAYFV
jgi:hypothetical protein